MNATELVTAVNAPAQKLGASHYFIPETQAAGEAIGLENIVLFYAMGRGGILGDVEASTIADAFYWFSPALIEMIWGAGKGLCDPVVAADAHLEAAYAFARRTFSDTEALRGYVEAASKVVAAAGGFSAPLFEGYRSRQVPADTPAAAIHLAIELRELRGDAFVDSAKTLGLSPTVGHFLAHPEMFALYGYSDADIPEITDADRTLRDEVEARCDELLAPAFAVLGADEASAMIAGLAQMDVEAGENPPLPGT
jgi:hypothetical protein